MYFSHSLVNVVINIFKLVSKHSLSLDLRRHFSTVSKAVKISRHAIWINLTVFLYLEDDGESCHFAAVTDRL